jgi:hypothetical protein
LTWSFIPAWNGKGDRLQIQRAPIKDGREARMPFTSMAAAPDGQGANMTTLESARRDAGYDKAAPEGCWIELDRCASGRSTACFNLWWCAMGVVEFVAGLVLGFLSGYGIREIISRRRHLRARQKRRMEL